MGHRRNEQSVETIKVRTSTPARKPSVNINRTFWERTRPVRLAGDIVFQGLLWSVFFFGRKGSLIGIAVVITFTMLVMIETYTLIRAAKLGNILDIAAELVVSISALMATFSTLYWNYGSDHNFTEQLTRIDAVYFTIGTLTTAGAGTISAVSQTARVLQSLQMILDMTLVVFAAALGLAAVWSQMQRRSDESTDRNR